MRKFTGRTDIRNNLSEKDMWFKFMLTEEGVRHIVSQLKRSEIEAGMLLAPAEHKFNWTLPLMIADAGMIADTSNDYELFIARDEDQNFFITNRMLMNGEDVTKWVFYDDPRYFTNIGEAMQDLLDRRAANMTSITAREAVAEFDNTMRSLALNWLNIVSAYGDYRAALITGLKKIDYNDSYWKTYKDPTITLPQEWNMMAANTSDSIRGDSELSQRVSQPSQALPQGTSISIRLDNEI